MASRPETRGGLGIRRFERSQQRTANFRDREFFEIEFGGFFKIEKGPFDSFALTYGADFGALGNIPAAFFSDNGGEDGSSLRFARTVLFCGHGLRLSAFFQMGPVGFEPTTHSL